MFRVPAPDRDDFRKFMHFQLYFFFKVSKAFAADPIKTKRKKNLKENILKADCNVWY